MRLGNRRGSALIEFAGSLILISTIFTGVFQLGYAFHNYNSLVNAVRAGARYASLQPAAASSMNPEFAKSVRNMVVYGDPAAAPGGRTVVPGLAERNVELVVGPRSMTVSIRDFHIDSLFAKIDIDGRPTVTFPCAAGAAK
jgi:Flp pilus assembly protein TadG